MSASYPVKCSLPTRTHAVLVELAGDGPMSAMAYRLLAAPPPDGPPLPKTGPRRSLSLRLHAEEVRWIDRIAEVRGWSRSGALAWWLTRALEAASTSGEQWATVLAERYKVDES